jgi:hypothetical protein
MFREDIINAIKPVWRIPQAKVKASRQLEIVHFVQLSEKELKRI